MDCKVFKTIFPYNTLYFILFWLFPRLSVWMSDESRTSWPNVTFPNCSNFKLLIFKNNLRENERRRSPSRRIANSGSFPSDVSGWSSKDARKNSEKSCWKVNGSHKATNTNSSAHFVLYLFHTNSVFYNTVVTSGCAIRKDSHSIIPYSIIQHSEAE